MRAISAALHLRLIGREAASASDRASAGPKQTAIAAPRTTAETGGARANAAGASERATENKHAGAARRPTRAGRRPSVFDHEPAATTPSASEVYTVGFGPADKKLSVTATLRATLTEAQRQRRYTRY